MEKETKKEILGARKYRDAMRRGMKGEYTGQDIKFILEVNKDDE